MAVVPDNNKQNFGHENMETVPGALIHIYEASFFNRTVGYKDWIGKEIYLDSSHGPEKMTVQREVGAPPQPASHQSNLMDNQFE